MDVSWCSPSPSNYLLCSNLPVSPFVNSFRLVPITQLNLHPSAWEHLNYTVHLLEKFHPQLCKSIAVKLQKSNHVYPYLCYTYKSECLICIQPHIFHSLCTDYLVRRCSKSREIKLPYIYIHILKLKEDFFVKWAKNFLPFVDLTS